MNFQHAVFLAAHGWTIAYIQNARIDDSIEHGLGEIHSIWRELLIVRAQVCCWKSDFLSQIIAAHNSSQDRVFAAKHRCRLSQIARFYGLSYRSAADDFAIDADRRNSHYAEIKSCAEFLEQFEIATSIFSKRPFVSNANFSQRFRVLH